MEDNLQIIWDALHGYREDCIPEKAEEEHYDKEWDEICTAMAHIHNALAAYSHCVELGIEETGGESKLDSQTKQEVFTALTKLYYVCDNNGWSRMAGAISMAEDVARQEADDLRLKETGGEL